MPDIPKKDFQVKNKISAQRDLKVTRFRTEIRKTEPHKHHGYFEVIFLSRGKGFHVIDSQKYEVKCPVLFVIRKEQVHYWELNSKPKGFVLIIKKEFLDTSIDGELKGLFGSVSAVSCLYPTNSKPLEQLFELLLEEYENSCKDDGPVISGLLKALLGRIAENSPLPLKRRKTTNLYERFYDLLAIDKSPRNNVAHYAGLLNTTPQNLNTACRKNASQSSAEVLAVFIIGEARRLLLYTNMTVAEISLSLGFKDNSHFVKYFKRHAQCTPSEFREGN
jgi:AraC-like DNA-binding protein